MGFDVFWWLWPESLFCVLFIIRVCFYFSLFCWLFSWFVLLEEWVCFLFIFSLRVVLSLLFLSFWAGGISRSVFRRGVYLPKTYTLCYVACFHCGYIKVCFWNHHTFGYDFCLIIFEEIGICYIFWDWVHIILDF